MPPTKQKVQINPGLSFRLDEKRGSRQTAYQFRPKFRDTLALALAVYPGAHVREAKAGVTLYPSDTAVAKRHLRIAS